ncbi:MAG: PilZ domain-containing protein [Proteobacteria bacterium]|nr:PilZ domain-containing protein [Pseudomonadota bacterium]
MENLNRAERHDLKIIGEINSTPQTGTATRPFLCNTLNMSLTGALLETSQLLPLGALLDYSFRLPGAGERVKVLAEIVRSEPAETKSKVPGEGAEVPQNMRRQTLGLYGIRFLEIKESDVAAIKSFLLS